MEQENEYNQAEMMVEPAPSLAENDQQQNSDESMSEAVEQLTLDGSVASNKTNDFKIIKKNDRNQTNAKSKDHSKCCAPDLHKGYNKRGQELDYIEANYLKVNVDNIVEQVYRYDVDIRTRGPRNFYTKVFMQFCVENLPIDQSKRIVFDDDKMLALSPCILNIDKRGVRRNLKFVLPDTKNEWENSKKSKNVRLNKSWDCVVAMRPAKNPFFIPIKRVLAGNDQYHRYDAIQAMNTILNSAYHQEHLHHGIQDGRSLYLELKEGLPDIREHYVLRSGLHQRIIFDDRDGSICPLLNVDVKHRAFPRQFTSLIKLLEDIQREDTTPRCVIEFKKPLTTDVTKRLQAHLNGLEICYKIDEENSGISKFHKMGTKAAHEIISHKNGTTVQKYFDDRNLRIKYPYFPCIRLEGFISVPLECCSIRGDQLVQKTLSEKQADAMKEYTVLDPDNRKDMIMLHLQSIGHNQCEAIRAFGIHVDENFIRVPARQLQPPLVEYRDRKMIKPKDGEWPMNYGPDQMEVISSPTSFKWSILNTDQNLQKIPVKIKQFAKTLYRKSDLHGIKLNEQPECIEFAELGKIKEKLEKMNEQEIDIVICIIPSSESKSREYSEIKIAADLEVGEVGILTQCIKSDTISNGTKYLETFLLNINAKLNGINQKLSTAPILKDFDTEPVMFIGAYITTPTTPGRQNAPSVAGMVASHDPDAFSYNIGRPSQDETVTTFQSNFTENLKSFRQKNGRLPTKLIYFRQEESGSPSHKAIESERKAMLRACREVDKGHDKIVKITIIIVEPELHMRLFPRPNAGMAAAKSKNVPPGTVIDTILMNRHQTQFYMVSQQGVEGVTRPTKYRIFLDEANHCIYDLQLLIFFLCHMFARCNRSVSSPAPTHHARLVARHSKVYLTNASVDAGADTGAEMVDNKSHRPVKNDKMFHL